MIPPRKIIKRLLSFSGGRTSGLMLWREIEKYGLNNFNKIFTVCFCNTGKERNETLDFVHEVEMRWKIPIVWVEYKRFPASTISPDVFPTKKRKQNHIKLGDELTHWFRVVNYETASRDGSPFDDYLSWVSALPNVVGRSCSAQLKIRTSMRYLFSIGWKEFDCYIGIRSDEAHRAIQIQATCENFLHPKFPLIEDGLTVLDVNRFWSESDFDLQLKNYEGNCDLCFLKSDWKRRAIMRQHPEYANWWIAKERMFKIKCNGGAGSTFRRNESYEGVLKDALHPELNFETLNNDDIPCSCAEKGFQSDEHEL